MTAIPTLTTARLRLVPPSTAHLPGEEGFWPTDRAQFVGGPIASYRVWRLLATHLGHWALRGYGQWALELHDGTHIGMAGLWHPGEWPEPEVGYHLYAGFEGRGYVTEAVHAVRDHAYRSLGWQTLISLIDPANTASQNVARRLGAVNTGATFSPAPDSWTAEIWRHASPDQLRAAAGKPVT